jgi:hypothetical protein
MSTTNESSLEVEVGWSGEADTRKAVAAATRSFREHRGAYGLVLVYSSIKHAPKKVLDEVRHAVGDVPIVGCTTTGGICRGGLVREGIVLAGLRAGALSAGVGYGRDVYRSPARAARTAVSMARRSLGVADRKTRLCIIHTAGFTMDKRGVEEDVVAAVADELGTGWTIVGGSAGDDARFLQSFQMAGAEAFDDAVAVALVSTDADVAHGMAHGFVPTDATVKATEVEGNLVKRLDGKLAAEAYAAMLSVPVSRLTTGLQIVRIGNKVPRGLMSFSQKLGLTPQRITDSIPFFSLSIEHPFGVQTPGGEVVVKVPKTITPEGFLEFHTTIPEGEALRVMRLDRDLTLSASDRAIAGVKQALGREPALLLVFECCGRYMYLLREIDALLAKTLAGTTGAVAGFFSSAEQGTMGGLACQTHNYSTSVLGIAG